MSAVCAHGRYVQNIVNNDFSEIVIENMKQKYKETAPDMDWLVMDVMDMKELPDASFDVAIDKGAAPSHQSLAASLF
jgi:ubiquinone/menaquinone biosynthesis C-methylase UbiE